MPRTGQKKRAYSDEEKAYALSVLEMYRGNVDKAAKLLEMPPRTLAHWAAGQNRVAAVEDIQAVKREEMHEALDKIAWKIVGAMELTIEEADLRALATSLGILIDKIQLLRGLATSRTEVSGPGGSAIAVSLGLDTMTDDELRERLAEVVGVPAAGGVPPAS